MMEIRLTNSTNLCNLYFEDYKCKFRNPTQNNTDLRFGTRNLFGDGTFSGKGFRDHWAAGYKAHARITQALPEISWKRQFPALFTLESSDLYNPASSSNLFPAKSFISISTRIFFVRQHRLFI